MAALVEGEPAEVQEYSSWVLVTTSPIAAAPGAAGSV